MLHQEASSRRKPWRWLLRPLRSRRADDAPVTSIVGSDEVIRAEVEGALEKFGIRPSSYRLQLLMCPAPEAAPGELFAGLEEWLLCITLTTKTGSLTPAMAALEKYLRRRLAPYAISVKAIYWRMASA